MILINDIARVVHGEIYRWDFGDTGHCNKNLGAVFLVVFHIGDAKELADDEFDNMHSDRLVTPCAVKCNDYLD
jgi:hypothetical protein